MATARNMRQIKPARRDANTIITITLELGGEERVYTLIPSKLPLIFMEALEELREDNSWRNMRLGIQKLLKLTDEEALELDTDSLGQIAAAMQEATDIPNAQI